MEGARWSQDLTDEGARRISDDVDADGIPYDFYRSISDFLGRSALLTTPRRAWVYSGNGTCRCRRSTGSVHADCGHDAMYGNDVQRLHFWAFAVLGGALVVLLSLTFVGMPAGEKAAQTTAAAQAGQSDAASSSFAFLGRKGTSNAKMASGVPSAALAGSSVLLATSAFALDSQIVLWLTTTLCLVMLLAYATNPGDASLRSHLTDVMLQNHIKHFQKQATTSAQQAANGDYSANGDPPLSTFVNRVSISLKTPTYLRHDFGVLSVVHVPSIDYVTPSQPTRFVGLFGKWWTCSSAAASAVDQLLAGTLDSSSATTDCGVLDIRPLDAVDVKEPQSLDRRRRDDEGAESKIVRSSSKTNEGIKGGTDSPLAVEKEGFATQSPSPASPVQHKDGSKEASAATSEVSSELQVGPPREVIPEADNQLDHIRITSDATKKSLQTQLDELRTRKRDEDATRLDVKARMKTLDEHKRHAEGTRREAERRLKAATQAQDLLKNRIETKEQQMRDLRAKLAAKEKRARQSAVHKDERAIAINQQIAEHQKDGEEVDAQMVKLQQRIESLEQQILSEEGNLQAASEMAAERAMQEEHMAAQNRAAMEHYSQGAMYQFPGPSGYDGYGPQDVMASDPTYASNPAWPDLHMQTAEIHGSTEASLPRDIDQRDNSISAFDPTVAPTPIRAAPSAPPLRFSPFSFDGGSTLPSHFEDPRDVPGQSMMTPGTADLLPSNLFQGADDDDEGAQAGSLLSEDSVLDKLASRYKVSTRLADADDDEAANAPVKGNDEIPASTSVKSSRSWWGGRPKSKAGSSTISMESDGRKQGEEGGDTAGSHTETSPPTAGKRRSLSIFPKMSLNPGAKSFRGPLKRVEQDSFATARSSFENAQPSNTEIFNGDWNASLSSLPSTRNDYEAMKRAFESGDATTSPRSSRQSNWSGIEGKGWPLTHRIFGPRASHLSGVAAAPRSSSDSMQPSQPSLGGTESNTDWLDDIVLPLERTTSLTSHRSADAASTGSPVATRPSKPSRFALFSGFNGASRGANSAEDASTSGKPGEEGNTEGQSGHEAAAAAAAASSTPTRSVTPGEPSSGQKPKRTSFRWTRKQSEASSTMPPFVERTPSRERTDKP